MTETTSASSHTTRRALLGCAAAGVASLVVPACTSTDTRLTFAGSAPSPSPDYVSMYAAVTDDGHNLPAIPFDRIDPRYLRQVVEDPTGEPPGTIVVDTSSYHLYVVQTGGTAMRYGVGLGRAGFGWSATAVIQWKKRWPTWTPPAEMIQRQPDLARYSAQNGGMPPGPGNPLGARALYIFRDGQDTMYRLHGSPEWNSVGKNVSSGCVRLMNQDVIDLYDRVPGKTTIIVRSSADGRVHATSGSGRIIPIDSGVPRDAELLT